MGSKFFGLEAISPWPELPKGRIIDEESRHATLIFYGNQEIDPATIPLPPFKLGLVGQFIKPLFLKNVIAWEPDFFAHREELFLYHQSEKWLPHVTLARKPYDPKEWKKAFTPLPVIFPNLHLYESMGNLKYEKIWTIPLIPPFEEIPHTADIAYTIRGETLQDLYLHALTALAFEFPPILQFREKKEFRDLNEIIATLGNALSQGDAEFGAPLKAVSYHGEIEEKNGLLEWEMIVDV